jgi:hypothetical protein
MCIRDAYNLPNIRNQLEEVKLLMPATHTINADEMAVTMDLMIRCQQPAMYWGPPGIGKSEIVWQVAKSLKRRVLDVRLLTRNPVDVMGLPTVLYRDPNHESGYSREPTKADHVGETIFSRPDLLPTEGEGILFLDELPAAGPELQACAYQLILDRCIGQHKLGDGWAVFAAGNRISDRGRSHTMLSPLADRFQHYDLKVEFAPWERRVIQNDIDIYPAILAYLRLRDKYEIEQHTLTAGTRDAANPNPFAQTTSPQASFGRAAPSMPTTQQVQAQIALHEHCGMLQRFIPTDRSFCTPRSWVKLSKQLYEIEDAGLAGSKIETATIAGKCGEVAATELAAFMRVFRAGFSLQAILDNPDSAPMPSDPGMSIAVASALARSATKVNIGNAYKYAKRALGEEYLVMMMKDAERRNSDIMATRAYRDYGVEYAHLMS